MVSEAKSFLTGPIMSLRTPFDSNGMIDYSAARRIIDVSLEGGSRTIMLTAGDSHYYCLSDDEILELTRVACEHTGNRGMVVAADRHHSTARSVELATHCKGFGADMFMVMPPDWASSCTASTLADHYAAVAQVLPVMIVTNVFVSRGAAFGLDAIRQSLDRSPNIVAIKDDMCGTFAQDLCMQFHDRAAIIAGGQKRWHLNIWPYGCTGYLSTLVAFNASVSQAYWSAISRGDVASASRIVDSQDAPLFDYLCNNVTGGFDAGMHGMLELYGLAQRYRRKPYHTITDVEIESLAEFLRDKELL